MTSPKFATARFHVRSGPSSLFERVRAKLAGRRELKLHASHLKERAADRGAPIEEITRFDPQEWELVTAEVRTDTCKFVNSTWRRAIRGEAWLLVIGLHDTVQTIYRARGEKHGARIIHGGELYDRVSRVNADLLQRDRDGSVAN